MNNNHNNNENNTDNNKNQHNTINTGQTNYSNDFDSVFKSMKHNNTNLFIPVINESFGRNYRDDEIITLLPSEGDITKISEEKADIHSKTSDFLLKIQDELYLLECQSYADGSMAIRIAEYAFIAAKQNAVWEHGRVTLDLPNYRIIYIKSFSSIPEMTKITYRFPNGQQVNYDARNIILNDYSIPEIMKKRLYPYIPYYILRYEKDIKEKKISIDFIEKELNFLLNGLLDAFEHGVINAFSFYSIKSFTNTILEHMMTGNNDKERLVKIMGGEMIYNEAYRIHEEGKLEGRLEGKREGRIEGIREGEIKQYIETSREYNADNEHIINGLMSKFQLSLDEAKKLVSQA